MTCTICWGPKNDSEPYCRECMRAKHFAEASARPDHSEDMLDMVPSQPVTAERGEWPEVKPEVLEIAREVTDGKVTFAYSAKNMRWWMARELMRLHDVLTNYRATQPAQPTAPRVIEPEDAHPDIFNAKKAAEYLGALHHAHDLLLFHGVDDDKFHSGNHKLDIEQHINALVAHLTAQPTALREATQAGARLAHTIEDAMGDIGMALDKFSEYDRLYSAMDKLRKVEHELRPLTFMGIPVVVDPNMPPDELKVVHALAPSAQALREALEMARAGEPELVCKQGGLWPGATGMRTNGPPEMVICIPCGSSQVKAKRALDALNAALNPPMQQQAGE